MIKDTLRDNEPTCERTLLLASLLLDALKNLLQTLCVVVVIPSDGRPRDLQPLLNSKIGTSVGDYDIATLAEGRDDGGNGRECLGIDNSSLSTQEIRDVLLELDMNVW